MPLLKLEVFETSDQSEKTTVVTDMNALEEARLAAYEQGYTAGWDDANAAQSDDQSRMRADLARNIQSLAFTWHEARVHVLRAVEPLLQDVVGRLLPEMAREALAPVVLETLMPLAEQMAEAPVTLVLNPAARPAVEALLEQATGLPLKLLEEPTLGEGQVYLRLGDTETRIDLDRATAEITAAVRSFFDLAEKDSHHG
ncbi:flagellar biosynthesis protein [Paracoccaceae bacterium Fryx2]|nr:flagellar biosynthesis protein [Paracoccaceae bacterium Fryx2]